MLHASASPYAMRQRGLQETHPLIWGCVPWVWGAWELARHVTSTELKQKGRKLHWETLLLHQRLVMNGHKLILDQMWAKQEGAVQEPFVSPVQDSKRLMVPRADNQGWQPGLTKETFASRQRRLALWREGQSAPAGYFWGTHKSPFQENGHFEHLPSPASNSRRPQGTNHEGWSFAPRPSREGSAAPTSGTGWATPPPRKPWGNFVPRDLAPLGRADWPSGATWPNGSQSICRLSVVSWANQILSQELVLGAPRRPQGGMKLSRCGERSRRSGCGIRDLAVGGGVSWQPKWRGRRSAAGWKW